MKLNLDIDVRTDGAAEIRRVEGQVQNLGEKVEDSGRKASRFSDTFKGAFAGIIAADVIGKLVSQVVRLGSEAIRLGDDMRNLSTMTGFSVETLSVLDVRARQAGSSIEGMRTGITQLARTQVEAARGNDTYAAMFDRIGISITDLQRLSPEEMFERVAQGLDRVESAGEKMALAQQLMGRSGAQLIPVLKDVAEQGLGGIRDAGEEAGYMLDTQTAAALASVAAQMEEVKRRAVLLGGEFARLGSLIATAMSEATGGITGVLNPVKLLERFLQGLAGATITVIAGIQGIGRTAGVVFENIMHAIRTRTFRGLGTAIVDSIKEEMSTLIADLERQLDQVFYGKGQGGGEGGAAGGLNLPQLTPSEPVIRKENQALKEQRDLVAAILEAHRKVTVETDAREFKSREMLDQGEHELQLAKERLRIAMAANQMQKVELQNNYANLEIRRRQKQALEELKRQLDAQAINEEAYQERRIQIIEQSNLEELAAFRSMMDDKARIEENHERERFLRWQSQIETNARIFAAGFESVLQSAFRGDSIEGTIRNLYDSFLRGWESTLLEMTDAWADTLASWAKGVAPEAGPMAGQAPTSAQQTGAQVALTGMQAGAALYGIYDQSQGVPKGRAALSGAISGAMAGAQIYGWIGAIVGALVGGVAGFLSGGVESKGFRIQLQSDGSLRILGFGGTKTREEEQAQRDLNETISKVRGTMFDIFTLLPTHVLQSLSQITPDLSFAGKHFQQQFGESKSAVDALKDFISVKVPQMIIDEYFEGPLGSALNILGLTGRKIDELRRAMNAVDFDEAQRLLADFLGAVVGLADHVDFTRVRDKIADVRAEMDKTVLDQMIEIDSRIKILASGFGDLPLAEQVQRAKHLNELVAERNALEQQMIIGLLRLSDQIRESVEDQIFMIEQSQRTEEEQIDALLGRQRDLFSALGDAQTEEEIARIMGLIQGNATELFNLMGRTPEAAHQITSMLRDAETLAQRQITSIIEAAVAIDNLLAQVLDDILDFLRGVSDERNRPVTRPGGGGGGTGGGGGVGPFDPEPIVGFNFAVADATSSVVDFASALQQSVVSLPKNINVEVTVEGSAAPFIQVVRADVRQIARYEVAASRSRRIAG